MLLGNSPIYNVYSLEMQKSLKTHIQNLFQATFQNPS
jgi:hypothetical protein